ncbi:MAG: hypothetical protein JSV82_02980 [Planctomycetota bacterium]|nr:MAG: hypothetical protein JSV82_02980 [Planctomycetota bacterium]
MTSARAFTWLAHTAVCLLLLAAGCAPSAKQDLKPEIELEKQIPELITQEAEPTIVDEAKEPKAEPEEQTPQTERPIAATLALKFTPQDSTTYRVTSEAQQSVKWMGDVPDDPNLKGKLFYRFEMTFNQQIQSIDDNGNVIAKITIEGLKCHFEGEEKPIEDFDSYNPKDSNHPLAKLTGQSYTIKISPTGEVTKVLDVKQARAAFKKRSPGSKTALAMLTPDVIKKRHGTLVLPDTNKSQLQTGDNWSNIKTFSFGSMVSKSYERIYTLKEIKNIDNRQVAIVEMNTIPAPETPEQSFEEQTDFSEMFDSTSKYTGRLRFDLSSGKIEKYLEKVVSEWTTVLPPGMRKSEEPVVLIMGAVRAYELEKID